MTDTRQWASMAEVADLLGVSKDTVRRRISEGTIPAHRLGPRLIRIRLADLDGFRRLPTR